METRAVLTVRVFNSSILITRHLAGSSMNQMQRVQTVRCLHCSMATCFTHANKELTRAVCIVTVKEDLQLETASLETT